MACGIDTYKWPYQLVRTNDFYCSRACSAKHLIGKPSNKPKEVKYEVNCGQCSNTLQRREERLKNENHFCNASCYGAWMHINKSGENHYNWKGGLFDHQKIYRSVEWKVWRHDVFERDDYVCQICFKRGGNLHAHHIRPKRDYPELTYDVNNGATLCKLCHLGLSNREEMYIEYFTCGGVPFPTK